jgi:hypothetical protein
MLLGHGPNKTFMVPESFGATDGTIENDYITSGEDISKL